MHITIAIIFFHLIQTGFSASQFYEFNYKVEDQDTFSRILKRFTKNQVDIKNDDLGVRKTFKENKNIKNWRSLESGNIFKIFIIKNKSNKIEILAYINRNKLFQHKKMVKTKRTKSAEVFYTDKYTVKKGDTFATILRQYVKENSVINATTPMIQKTRSENPQIKEWTNLKAGAVITLYISKRFLNISKIKSARKRTKKRRSNNHLSAFYTFSTGSFNELLPSQIEADYKQNSPFTLGVMGSSRSPNARHVLDYSGYLSYLQAGEFQGASTDNINISPEIGLTAHYRYIAKFILRPFLGAETEKFSTFNLVEFSSLAAPIATKTHIMALFALGFQTTFYLGKYALYLKSGYARSLFHSSETATYSGDKIIFFSSIQLHKRVSYHFLYKRYALTGPTELKVTRFGLGLSYFIF